MEDPALVTLRQTARSSVAAESVAWIVYRNADRLELDPTAVLTTVDWDAHLRVGPHGEVSERAVKRLLRAVAKWQAAE